MLFAAFEIIMAMFAVYGFYRLLWDIFNNMKH